MPYVGGAGDISAQVNSIMDARTASLLSEVVPPPVNSTGAVGTSGNVARADHTHVSSIQKIVLGTDASGNVAWTYPMPFTVSPVVQVTVEASSGQPYLALITSNSATGVAIKVLRMQMLPASLTLITNLQNFNVTAGTVTAGVNVHIYAAKATS